MESDGGGKMRPKRNQTGNKPYDRKSVRVEVDSRISDS